MAKSHITRAKGITLPGVYAFSQVQISARAHKKTASMLAVFAVGT